LQLAEDAADYTGADLSALLAEAQLAAAHEVLEAYALSDSGTAAGGGGRQPHDHAQHAQQLGQGPPPLQARHLQAALQATRPSLPPNERARLEAIYARFQQGRDPGLSPSRGEKGKGKMVSWA
jgi:SpoVK/Ycf46/Vps4 family AAA+-type ATPase